RSYPPLSSPRRLPPPPRALVESRPEAFPSSRRASTVTATSSQVDLERSSIPALDRISTVERPTGEHELEPESAGEADALADLVARVLKSGVDLPVDVDDRSRRAIEAVVAQELEAMQHAQQRGHALNLEALRKDALLELTELGPLGRLMADEAVTEISLPRYDQLTVVRQNRKSDLAGFATPRTLELAVLRLCHVAGITPDGEGVSRGKLEGGLEFEAMLSPALRTGPWLLLRKSRRLTGRLENLVRSGVISRGMATFLQQATAARLRLLIVGSRGADAGQIVSALCAAAGADRLVGVQSLDAVAAERAAVRLSLTGAAADAGSMVRALAHTASSRLVVDLAQTDVAVAVLDAVAEGADGLIATTRAPNLRSAWSKLTADILTVRPQLPLAAAREWLASCFDLMLEVGQLRDGRVRVVRICEPGADGSDVAEIFGFVAQRTAAGGLVEGTFTWSGHTPRAAQEMTARGVSLDSSVFARPATRWARRRYDPVWRVDAPLGAATRARPVSLPSSGRWRGA